MFVLNCPPEEWPNSGENWFVISENSPTASLGTYTRGPVTDLSLLSIPSMVKLLLRGRCPPTDGPTPMPIPPVDATFGLSSDTFKTPVDPFVALGRIDNSFVSNVWVRLVDVVSRLTVASADTSMLEVALVGVSVRDTDDLLLKSMRTLWSVYTAKPCADATTL